MSFLGLETYELLKEEEINEIHSKGYILRHKKSGARIALISNDDNNKVFYIGFRTPPEDSTGVPHIVEHTVLCGSDKFPSKDPFVELVKGSLNTFLNAMTFPDKTLYPIASYNDQDYKNLMDVYMDAVLHPNILKFEEIFKQEGWHYELEDKDSPITINGVVYNEMKGAYSSPEEIMQNCIYKSLYPDTIYSNDSGGNPDCIPELTHEAYLDFYKKYYHPSNSYIYLYGDFDIKERLEWMDKEYLCEFDESVVNSEIVAQTPYKEMKYVTKKFPISSEESEDNNYHFSYNKVIGSIMDKRISQAFAILDYVLISAPGAPVRQALLDAGIGQDVFCSMDDGICQPNFGIHIRNANACDKDRFVEVVETALKNVIKEGVNKTSVLAGINSAEFRYREADYGQFPKGLLYGLQCMDGWLYDDLKPFINFQMLEIYDFLKEQTKTSFYEDLIQKYLLDNNHGAIIVLEPEKGLNQKNEKALEDKLAAFKATLSDDELEKMITDTAHLKEYQSTPSPEEDILKIPMLERKDMKKEVEPYSNVEETICGVPVVRHEYQTNGIDYLCFLFNANDVLPEDVPYMAFLRNILSFVDTETYSYAELNDVVNLHSGGISSGVMYYPENSAEKKFAMKYEFRIKVLEDKLSEALDILSEIILTSKIDDEKRLAEIIAQTKSRLQTVLSSSGHVVSATRSVAYFSEHGYLQDASSGITYYDAVCEMEKQFEKEPSVVIERLRKLLDRMFGKSRLLISYTNVADSYKKAVPVLQKFIEKLPEGMEMGQVKRTVLGQKNEGFTDASAIQYVSRSGNFANHGFKYHGALNILRMILSYDYLWLNVRVQGGAYGCSSSFLRSGESYFTSYRDPNLRKTNEVYDGIPEYLRNFKADEREMTKYIIGTLGGMDTPLYPEGKGTRSMSAYLRNLTEEEIQLERDQILNATDEDIRNLADMMEAVLSEGNFCVLGNEDNIRKEGSLFKEIRSLNE